MNKTSLVFKGDASGCRFATMAHDESTENQPGVIGDIKSFEKLGRVCETDSAKDGYSVLQKWLAKLTRSSKEVSEIFFLVKLRGKQTSLIEQALISYSVATAV